MRRLAVAGTVLLVAAAGASSGLAAKPAKGGTVTLTAAPSVVTFGSPATLSGVLSTQAVGVKVTAEAQPFPFTGKYQTAGTAQTTAGGAYSITVTPALLTHYRVMAASPKATSPVADVAVRWKVGLKVGDRTPKRGARVRFSGSVMPVDANGIGLVQRHGASGWKTVRQTPLTTNAAGTASVYSTRVRVRSTARYRVRVAADASHQRGTSRALRLKVHA